MCETISHRPNFGNASDGERRGKESLSRTNETSETAGTILEENVAALINLHTIILLYSVTTS